jgi:hypothetical protein
MNATLCLAGRTRRTFHMPLSQFLQTRLMRERARRALCEPAELLAEHIYGDPRAADPEELSAMIAEACETATEFRVDAVTLAPADVHHFCRFLPLPPDPPPANAAALAA